MQDKKTVFIACMVSEQLKKDFNAHCQKNFTTMSQVVNKLIFEYMQKEKKVKPNQ